MNPATSMNCWYWMFSDYFIYFTSLAHWRHGFWVTLNPHEKWPFLLLLFKRRREFNKERVRACACAHTYINTQTERCTCVCEHIYTTHTHTCSVCLMHVPNLRVTQLLWCKCMHNSFSRMVCGIVLWHTKLISEALRSAFFFLYIKIIITKH